MKKLLTYLFILCQACSLWYYSGMNEILIYAPSSVAYTSCIKELQRKFTILHEYTSEEGNGGIDALLFVKEKNGKGKS